MVSIWEHFELCCAFKKKPSEIIIKVWNTKHWLCQDPACSCILPSECVEDYCLSQIQNMLYTFLLFRIAFFIYKQSSCPYFPKLSVMDPPLIMALYIFILPYGTWIEYFIYNYNKMLAKKDTVGDQLGQIWYFLLSSVLEFQISILL